MAFVPHSDAERAAMLAAIGANSLEDLIAGLPKAGLFPDLALPEGCSEMELAREMRDLAAGNLNIADRPSFLGAGAYGHFIPAAVDSILQRAEFFTAYTPYQPELSQGMLQAMFEYQSMICALTGMEVSNASHYDGATALAEAVRLALEAGGKGRDRVFLSPAIDPQYREVVRTYLAAGEGRIEGDDDPNAEIGDLVARLGDDVAAFVVQTPNFFGQFESVDGLAEAVHAAGAMLIVVADPISLGLFKAPGDYGADIVVAEGQPLGIPPSFGGPHLGIFATRNANIRRLVGRLVGETTDTEGRRGYVLTLATREQHIRRARATSNICTNSALTALAATAYLALMGRRGLGEVARLCYHKAHYAAGRLGEINGVTINPQGPGKPFFKEFVVSLPCPVSAANAVLLDDYDIVGGADLGRTGAEREGHMLVAVTEMRTRKEIDRLVEGVEDAVARHG